MRVFLLLDRFALAAVFIVAGVAKLRDARGSRKVLADFGVPPGLVAAAAVLVPMAELACAITLLHVAWAVPGAFGALALLAIFTAGIAASLAGGRAPKCPCFGRLSSSPVSWRTLVRNLILLILAGMVAWKTDPRSVWPVLSLGAVEIAELADIGSLVVAMALMLWFLSHLLRQNGRLLLRLEAVEKKLAIDLSAVPAMGLDVGNPAPAFELRAIEGGTMNLERAGKSGRPVLLVFTEPECGACEELQPKLAVWQREYAGRLVILPISRGDLENNRLRTTALGLRNVLVQADREVTQAYMVTAAPSAVLVVGGRIASRIEAGSDAIRALIERATASPRVRRGEAVPSIKLPDLAGGTTDLSTLRGRRTLLLFWNPSCGFCQKMLPALKARRRPEGAPDLVLISSGSIEANLQQGLHARVLFDPAFDSGRVFGAAGTPSAVVLDELGKVASEVGMGAPAVFALAGAELQANWA